MSLEISLRKKGEEDEIMSLNWLRNPFGLERWAAANTEKENVERGRLWYVCNHWNYDKAKKIDTRVFKEIIDKYWGVIRELREGCFGPQFARTKDKVKAMEYTLKFKSMEQLRLGFIMQEEWGKHWDGKRWIKM